jgi:hypothetical protein
VTTRKEPIFVNKKFKDQLLVKKEITGRPIHELVEYARFPFIPPKKKMFRNKRGNFTDIADYIGFAVAFGIMALFVIAIITNFNTEIQTKDNSTVPQTAKNTSSDWKNAVPNGLDYLFLFGTLIFIIGSVIFARLIPSSPVFMIIAFILMIILPLVAMVIENVWDGFIQHSTMALASSEFVFMPFVLNNLVYFTLFYVIIVAVALYTKGDFNA